MNVIMHSLEARTEAMRYERTDCILSLQAVYETC
jgi:hypothetical protein